MQAFDRFLATDLGPYMILVIAVLISLEGVIYFFKQMKTDIWENMTSIFIGIGYFLVNVVGAKLLFLALYVYVYNHWRLFTLDIYNPLVWLALLLLGDFAYYWIHRAEHEVRFFWCAHMNHHSAREYTFATAIRMPWGEVTYHPLLGLWQPLLGFHPIMYPALQVFNLLGGLLLHTRLVRRLGPLEWLLNTPSHHRVHHGTELPYLDRNFGARLIIWDRWFGTFQEEKAEPTYGLTEQLDTYNPFRISAQGYLALWRDLKAAPDWSSRLQYLFQPPGWHHEQTHKTVRFLRAQALYAAMPQEGVQDNATKRNANPL